MSDHLPWTEKYRPRNLNDIYGHNNVIKTIRQFVAERQIPHLLFYGPPGTGKTSTVIAIAREIYGEKYKSMVLELNASDDRGIEATRGQIKTFASTGQMFAKGFKLVILDEADSMTSVAQNALRRIIEKYSAHTRFCILANFVHKLNPALLSRCTRFRFSPLSSEAVTKRIDFVINQEHINIDHEAREALVCLASGDMRKALSVLQACYIRVEGQIEAKHIYECVGSPDPRDIEHILYALLKEDWETCVSTITQLKTRKGLALADILQCLANQFITLDGISEYRGAILAGLSDIEWRLSNGGSEKLQTSGMIAVVKQAVGTK